MRQKTKKEYGTELEQYTANKFIELGYEHSRPTRGSGAKGECGDVQNPIAVVECKHINKPNITIKNSVWKKLNSEIPLGSERFPMYVLQNGENTRLVCLDVDDFFIILEGYLKNDQS